MTSCGCVKLKYHDGEIINNRLILNIFPENPPVSSNREHYYLCRCLLCNQDYLVNSNSLHYTARCGCLKSKGELEIIRLLKKNNIPYIYQYSVKELGRQKFDFAIINKQNQPILLIEFDGEQHYIENIKENWWNNHEYYTEVEKHDQQKDEYAKKHNIPLVRIPYWKRGKITIEDIFDSSIINIGKIKEDILSE